MSSCETFRKRFHAETEDAALLSHLRECDRCLDFAAAADPDVMFRALGGGELVPPGGIDAFVGEVMQQVRVRGAESTLVPATVVSWPRRLAIAATIAVGLTGGMLAYRAGTQPAIAPGPAQIARGITPVTAAKLTTKPVVETYQSDNATIVEMPVEDTGADVKIVMIFDENLPADL